VVAIEHNEYEAMKQNGVLYKSDYPIPDLLFSIVASVIVSIAIAWSIAGTEKLIVAILIAFILFSVLTMVAVYFFGKRIIIKSTHIEICYMIFKASRNRKVQYQQISWVKYNSSVYASKPILSIYYYSGNNNETVFRCEVYWEIERIKEILQNNNVKLVQA